jgi:hypothetical protein
VNVTAVTVSAPETLSVTVTLFAAPDPVFVTVTVKLKLLPTVALAGPDFTMPRSPSGGCETNSQPASRRASPSGQFMPSCGIGFPSLSTSGMMSPHPPPFPWIAGSKIGPSCSPK